MGEPPVKTVHKVEITLMPFPMPVHVPKSARILYVAQQYPHSASNEVSIWFEIVVGSEGEEPDPTDIRMVAAYGTGTYIPDNSVYLSTHILSSGRLVLHLYEMTGLDPEDPM